MRSNPDYTNPRRQAIPPADDDFMMIWQRDPKSGAYQQRVQTRGDFEERTLLIVDQDRAELTERVLAMAAAQAVQQKNLEAMLMQQAELIAQLQARKAVVALPDVTVTASQLVTLTAGERTFSNLPCAGVLTTDTIVVTPKSIPSGFGLRGWSIPQNGRIALRVQCPVLTVGTTALTVSVTAFR